MSVYVTGGAEQDDEIERLREQVAEFEEMHRIVIEDRGAPDELHCSCVPSLRLEIKRLNARLAEAEALLREATSQRAEALYALGTDGDLCDRIDAFLEGSHEKAD